MKQCFATVPLTNLTKTNHYARKNNCCECNDKYNCLCASFAQLKSAKQWVRELIDDVKQDELARQVIDEINNTGLVKACENNQLVKDYFVSMVKDDYLYHLTHIETIKESLKLMGIDINYELKIEENDG